MEQILRWCGVSIQRQVIQQRIIEASTLLEQFPNLREALRNVISEAIGRGIEYGLLLLESIKEEIVTMCNESGRFAEYKKVVSAAGGSGNTLGSSSAGCITKLVIRPLVPQAGKSTVKKTCKAGFKLFGYKFGVYASKKAVVKQSSKILAAANPVGMIADVAQVGCEAAGYKTANWSNWKHNSWCNDGGTCRSRGYGSWGSRRITSMGSGRSYWICS